MENYHKLTNLIWVWNGQDKCMEVSPDTFDICGDDIYSVKEYDHSSQKQRFEYMTELAHGKMITLSECGYIPDPDEMKKDNAMAVVAPVVGRVCLQEGRVQACF